ncbi:unnamed protein product, partial [Amoebophrya sp. A25]
QVSSVGEDYPVQKSDPNAFKRRKVSSSTSSSWHSQSGGIGKVGGPTSSWPSSTPSSSSSSSPTSRQ